MNKNNSDSDKDNKDKQEDIKEENKSEKAGVAKNTKTRIKKSESPTEKKSPRTGSNAGLTIKDEKKSSKGGSSGSDVSKSAGPKRSRGTFDGSGYGAIHKCSFCGTDSTNVEVLIQGSPGLYICNNCVELCVQVLHRAEPADYGESDSITEEELKKLPSPKEIKERLDEYVIGQDQAKRLLAVSVYNHYKRVLTKPKPESKRDEIDKVELQKSNILLLGPTGSGKTLLAQTLARILNVPFAIADATALTEAGYVGEDVENILLRLIQNADFNIARAEQGIIYVDEIDKITRKSDNPSITRDVSGEGVQQALLKILESTIANVPAQGGRKHPHQEFVKIDTTNILFILGGAFDGLDKLILERTGHKAIGFGAQINRVEKEEERAILNWLQPEDLLKYGLIPEFVGRVPAVVALEELDVEALQRILTEPKNALAKQYGKLLRYDGADLEFTDEALAAIAQKAIELKTGARGLRSIIEDLMLDVMYEVPAAGNIAKVLIEEACVTEFEPPKMITDKGEIILVQPGPLKKAKMQAAKEAAAREKAAEERAEAIKEKLSSAMDDKGEPAA